MWSWNRSIRQLLDLAGAGGEGGLRPDHGRVAGGSKRAPALVALFISIGLARTVATYGETWAGWTFCYTVGVAAWRRNLFAAHLRRPARRCRPSRRARR